MKNFTLTPVCKENLSKAGYHEGKKYFYRLQTIDDINGYVARYPLDEHGEVIPDGRAGMFVRLKGGKIE